MNKNIETSDSFAYQLICKRRAKSNFGIFSIPKSLIDFDLKMSEEQNGNRSNGEKKVTFEEMDCTTKPDSTDVAETVQDPFCDENNPRVITFQDVCQAAFMIRGAYLFSSKFQLICQAIM